MKAYKYALSAISRNKFRSNIVWILVLVTTVCVFGTGLFTDNIQSGAEKLHGTTATDLYVVPEEYIDSAKDLLFAGKACTVLFRENAEEKIAAVPGVGQVSRQLYLETLEMGCCAEGGMQIVAYDPETDFSVEQWGGQAKKLSATEVLVGSAGGYTRGEHIALFGRDFTVAGILEETGMGYDSSIFMTYAAADAITSSEEYNYMFGKRAGLVSMLLVRLEIGADIAEVESGITEALAGMRLKAYATDELAAGLRSQIRMVTGTVRIMDVFAVLIAGVSLFAMVTVTLEQRRKTAGSLLSVGCGKGKILEFFFTEYLFLFLAGTVVGIVTAGIFLLPLHNVLKTVLGMPYKLISAGQAAALIAKTLTINFVMLAAALSLTFVTIMKEEPAMLTGEAV